MRRDIEDVEEDDEVCRVCGYLYLECECPDSVQGEDTSQNCRANCPEHANADHLEIPSMEEVPDIQLELFPCTLASGETTNENSHLW